MLVEHYIGKPPADDLNEFARQYAEVLWLEQREIDVTAAAIAKAFNGS